MFAARKKSALILREFFFFFRYWETSFNIPLQISPWSAHRQISQSTEKFAQYWFSSLKVPNCRYPFLHFLHVNFHWGYRGRVRGKIMSLGFPSGLRLEPLSPAGLHACMTNQMLATMKWHPKGIKCNWRNMGWARALHHLSGVVSLISHRPELGVLSSTLLF